MARVFQAYGCRYAMQLDMNALEHTYFALYTRRGRAASLVQHLIEGMAVVDRKGGEQTGAAVPGLSRRPRFLLPDREASRRREHGSRHGAAPRSPRASCPAVQAGQADARAQQNEQLFQQLQQRRTA